MLIILIVLDIIIVLSQYLCIYHPCFLYIHSDTNNKTARAGRASNTSRARKPVVEIAFPIYDRVFGRGRRGAENEGRLTLRGPGREGPTEQQQRFRVKNAGGGWWGMQMLNSVCAACVRRRCLCGLWSMEEGPGTGRRRRGRGKR
jgi:hypothetical protein